MNKVETIKLRVTPAFKARVVREAAYRQLSISEMTVRALEAELRVVGSSLSDPRWPEQTAVVQPIESSVEPPAQECELSPESFRQATQYDPSGDVVKIDGQPIPVVAECAALAKRLTPCVHGKQPWIYCPKCD